MTAWLSGALVVSVAGRPHRVGFVESEVIEIISKLPDDDVDSIKVERVFGPKCESAPIDVTKGIANTWSIQHLADRGWNGGIEPSDYLAPFPAFVRHWYGDDLVDRWRAEHEPMARAS